MPSYLSPEAKQLLSAMLVVDPVKRITISEIRQLPWFNVNLPPYLQPLPPTPAVEKTGFNFGLTPTPPAETNAVNPLERGVLDANGDGHGHGHGHQTLYLPDLGTVEPHIVDELAEKMVGFTREDVWHHLSASGDNQVKVAYQLVRDHKRMIQDCEFRSGLGHDVSGVDAYTASLPLQPISRTRKRWQASSHNHHRPGTPVWTT